MKPQLLAALFVGCLVATAGLLSAAYAPADKAATKEYARIEGTWNLVSLQMDGKKMPEKSFKGTQLICKGRDFTFVQGKESLKGTFKVDVSKTPRQMDATFTNGPEAGKTALCIFELTDDTYRICVALVGKPRPTAFASKAGTGHVLEVFKRAKADAKAKDGGGK